MEFQIRQDENKNKIWDFDEIARNRDLINDQWKCLLGSGLRINSNNVNLSLELLLKKINLYVPLQKMSNKKKNSIKVKNRVYKKMCQTKDPLNI